jgi:hypothetical protein
LRQQQGAYPAHIVFVASSRMKLRGDEIFKPAPVFHARISATLNKHVLDSGDSGKRKGNDKETALFLIK